MKIMNTEKLIEDYLSRVERLIKEEAFFEGKNISEEILTKDPENGKAHFYLGWLYYYELNDYEKAEYHFDIATQLTYDHAATYINYVYLLNDLNDKEKFIAMVHNAFQIRGVKKSVLYNEIGRREEMDGNFDKAIHNYQLALQLSMGKDEVKVYRENIERVKLGINPFDKIKSRYHLPSTT